MSGNGTNVCTNFTYNEDTIIAGLHVVTASISFFAAAFVICLIVLFKKYRVFVQRLVLYLSMAAMMSSLVNTLVKVDYIVKNSATEIYCVVIGFLAQYTQWTMLLAVCILTLDILLKLKVEAPSRYETKFFEVLYVGTIFLVPLTFNSVPFVFDAYGNAGEWCWIKNSLGNCTAWEIGVIFQFSLWWGPLFAILLGLMVVYFGIVFQLQWEKKRWRGKYDHDEQMIRKNIRKEIRSIFWFPIIFIIFNVFPLANRIQNAVDQTPILALWIMHAVVSPLQGGFIALAYSLDPETRKRLNWADICASFRNFMKQDQGKVKEYTAVVTTEGIASPYEPLMNNPEIRYNYSSTK